MISLEQASSYAASRPDIAAGLVRVVRAGIAVHIASLAPQYEDNTLAGQTNTIRTEMNPQRDTQPHFIGPAGLIRAHETSTELTKRQLAIDNAFSGTEPSQASPVTGITEVQPRLHPFSTLFIASQNARRSLRQQEPGMWV